MSESKELIIVDDSQQSAVIQKQMGAANDIQLLSGNQLSQDDSMLLASMFQSGYFKDIDSLSKAVTRCVFGKMLNIPIAVALTGLYIIDGKPGLESKTIRNQLRNAGYEITPITLNDRECLLEWKFNGEKLGESSFTAHDAVLRGYIDPACEKGYPAHASHDVSKWSKRTKRYETMLGCDCKDNWIKMPQEMLMARATTRGNDRYGGRAFNNQEIYDIHELNDSPFRVDTEPMEIATGKIKNVTTLEELQAVVAELTPEQVSEYNQAIQTKTEELLKDE